MSEREDAKAQTPDQAEITEQGAGGIDDSNRNRDWKRPSDAPSGDPAPLGGSSDGRSDSKPSAGKGA